MGDVKRNFHSRVIQDALGAEDVDSCLQNHTSLTEEDLFLWGTEGLAGV